MKKTACISMNKEQYRKLHVIHTVRKYFFDDKDITIAKIVEDALNEYFEKHKQELDDMMKEYHDKGGCFDL